MDRVIFVNRVTLVAFPTSQELASALVVVLVHLPVIQELLDAKCVPWANISHHNPVPNVWIVQMENTSLFQVKHCVSIALFKPTWETIKQIAVCVFLVQLVPMPTLVVLFSVAPATQINT